MPSVSDKQKRFMQAAAHNRGFAKRAGISQEVAKDFVDADKAVAQKTTRSMIKKRYGKD